MITKRQVRKQLLAELKDAYRAVNTTQPVGDDWDEVSQAIGRYDGLKRAYILLTGRLAADVASEVVRWYIATPEYRASKQEGYSREVHHLDGNSRNNDPSNLVIADPEENDR